MVVVLTVPRRQLKDVDVLEKVVEKHVKANGRSRFASVYTGTAAEDRVKLSDFWSDPIGTLVKVGRRTKGDEFTDMALPAVLKNVREGRGRLSATAAENRAAFIDGRGDLLLLELQAAGEVPEGGKFMCVSCAFRPL